jgi:hypothetical protein
MDAKVKHGIAWRRKFVELSESIFRELGFPPPEMLHDDYQPLAMEMEHAGKPFELIHSSTEMPERVLVSCNLGQLPEEGVLPGLRKMLQANLTLARIHGPVYGLISENQSIRCMYYEKLDDAMASRILEKMRQVASDSENWRENFFLPAGYASTKLISSNQFSLA